MRVRRRNVQRVDHHHFHGWLVSLKRAGKRHQRYFHDQRDPKAALERALVWRDRMALRLPPPRKFKRRYTLNKTGIIGSPSRPAAHPQRHPRPLLLCHLDRRRRPTPKALLLSQKVRSDEGA